MRNAFQNDSSIVRRFFMWNNNGKGNIGLVKGFFDFFIF